MNPDLVTPKNGNAPLDVPNAKRILIIGDPGIGKTSLIKTYLEYSDNKHVTESSRFYLKMYLTRMIFNENIYPTYLVDVPPNLPTPDRIRSYPLVDAVVLCFAIDDPQSLASFYETWLEDLKFIKPAQAGSAGVPVVLAGLRKDRRTMPEVVQSLQNNGMSPVTREQGEAVRAANNFKHYFECSTNSLEGIHDTIDHAFYAGMEANPQ
ncbi:GTP-binding protein rhoC [Trichonephila clavipes]|nr:GTP-binding protein rhoC [Trichonephila clavipes]